MADASDTGRHIGSADLTGPVEHRLRRLECEAPEIPGACHPIGRKLS
jgi:hypothetical protein